MGTFKYIGTPLTPAGFAAYVQHYDFGPIPPDFVVLHHTAVPSATWARGSSGDVWDAGEAGLTEDQIKAKRKRQLDGIKNFYVSEGWETGPHLMIDERWIWLFTPMFDLGTHARWGNAFRASGKLHYSIGIEVVGDYSRTPWPTPVARLVRHAVRTLQERLGTFEMRYLYPGAADKPGMAVRNGVRVCARPERLRWGGITSHRDYNKPECPGDAITEAFYMDVLSGGDIAADQPGAVAQGVVLTHAYALDQVRDALTWGGYNALKVVTGWGLEGGWTDATRDQAAALAPTIVVRSVAGDPSYHGGARRLPDPNQLVEEFAPWVAACQRAAPRAKLWLEIGNEPNIHTEAETVIWEYRAVLDAAITRLRAAFPQARLIAPALLIDAATKSYRRWLEICADVFKRCHAVGVHLYEYDAFDVADQRHGTTGQLAAVAELYPRLLGATPLFVTELGINDPGTSEPLKGQRYARFAASGALPHLCGVLAYHLCAKDDIDPAYALHRLSHEAFAAQRQA